MTPSTPAFFTQQGDVFIANDPARGPWSADHCHAGPVAGLLARAAEQQITDKWLTRLTIELMRPVPTAGFRITAETIRHGRSTALVSATLTSLEGKICATATSSHLAQVDLEQVPTPDIPTLDFTEAKRGPFPVKGRGHDRQMFADFAEIAYPPDEDDSVGPTTVWMKTPSLLPNEEMTPFQTLCPIADCANGTARNSELGEYSYPNTDLTITAIRPPTSRWLATAGICHWDHQGIGLSHATLFDQKGLVGTAQQTLLLRRLAQSKRG